MGELATVYPFKIVGKVWGKIRRSGKPWHKGSQTQEFPLYQQSLSREIFLKE